MRGTSLLVYQSQAYKNNQNHTCGNALCVTVNINTYLYTKYIILVHEYGVRLNREKDA
jgi:hypothetical protein